MAKTVSGSTTMISEREWRVTDLDQMPRGYRYEIIDGVLYMAGMPFWPHPMLVHNLMHTLGAWLIRQDLGYLLPPQTGVYWSPINYLDPDLIFVRTADIPERRGRLKKATLAIEVLSDSSSRAPREDREELFMRIGLEEVWYIDPSSETLERCRRVRTGFEVVAEYAGDDRISCELFPGYELRLAWLFQPLTSAEIQ